MLLNLKWICCTLNYDSECIVYSSVTFTSSWDWEPCWFSFQSFNQVLTYGQFKPELARWNLLTLCVKTHEIQEIMRAGIQVQAAGINIINRLARVSRIWQIYTIFCHFPGQSSNVLNSGRSEKDRKINIRREANVSHLSWCILKQCYLFREDFSGTENRWSC